MSRSWVALTTLFLCSLGVVGTPPVDAAPPTSGHDADFMNEIRLSCEKYAKEDQIPPKEVKEYIALCIRDFSEAQPTDEFPPFESEEGIQSGPPSTEYVPLEKSMEMEKARPIDPPAAGSGKSASPANKSPLPGAPATSSPTTAKPPVPVAPAAPPVAAKPPLPVAPVAPPPAAAKPAAPAAPVVPVAPMDGKDSKKSPVP
ncbi:MAG: hypothetical protein H7836_04140 [Magnetococcus sp. YQC-3]